MPRSDGRDNRAWEWTRTLGNLSEKLLVALGKAQDRTGNAVQACAAQDAKHAKSSLKKVVRQLIQYSHRLRSRIAAS